MLLTRKENRSKNNFLELTNLTKYILVISDCETVRKIVFYTVKYLKSHYGYCILLLSEILCIILYVTSLLKY